MKTSTVFLALICAFFSLSAHAQSAWVSDRFEITLRTGPSTQNAIQMMLSSGVRLEVLETDSGAGYTRVRTQGGTEGWVLSRYLMAAPSAREQLQTLTSQLTDATSTGDSLEEQLAAVRGEYASAQQTINQLERDKTRLQEELDDITRTAANALSMRDQNTRLREQLADAEIQVGTLEQENRVLSSQKNRYWFVTGGAVIVVGILLGLWLPRIRMPRKSRYDRF